MRERIGRNGGTDELFGGVVADFPAGLTIVVAIGAEPNGFQALTQRTEPVAAAFFFHMIALHAAETRI